jgi:hypothetical protein
MKISPYTSYLELQPNALLVRQNFIICKKSGCYTRLSSWPLGVNVAGARDRFWGCHHLALLRLAVKLSHVWDDVDGITCHLNWPMDYG